MRKKRRDKYDVTGNIEAQYVDEAQTVLVNKLGITDFETLQYAEEEALVRAYENLLGELRANTPMTSELLRFIHRSIYGDLYDWAGRWRTVVISKEDAIWPPPQYLDEAMQTYERDVLSRYPAEQLQRDDSFCRAVAEIQGEFLAIHPFREGNARTIKVMCDLLGAQTGRKPLIYDMSDQGVEEYIAAARAALLRKQFDPMTEVIRRALEACRDEA